jgi:hypothetical protein
MKLAKLPFVLKHLQQKSTTELLFDFILEDRSPLQLADPRLRGRHLRTNAYEEALHLLMEICTLPLSENELRCVVTYFFLDRLIILPKRKQGFLSRVCRDNNLLS